MTSEIMAWISSHIRFCEMQLLTYALNSWSKNMDE